MGGPHPLRDPRRKILGKIKAGQIQAVTNTELLQEIIYRFFSIGNPSLGEVAYRSMVQFCAIILPITLKDTDLALRILKDHPPHYLARCHPRRHHAEPWAKRDHFCRFPLRPHRGDQKNRSGALALKCFFAIPAMSRFLWWAPFRRMFFSLWGFDDTSDFFLDAPGLSW